MRPSVQGALLAAASAIAYGALGVLARVAYDEGWSIPSLLVARFGLACLCLLPFALRGGASWIGFPAAILVGVLGYASTTALYFPSLRLIPVAVASFLLYLAPVLVAALSFALFRERLGRRGLVALALAVLGLGLLCAGAFTGALSTTGVLLAAGSAVTYAGATLASRRVTRDLPWARSALGVALGALLAYLAFGLATRQLALPPSPRGMLAALGIGTLCGGLALALFMAALPRIGASRTSVISTLEPVSTLILGAIFLGESPAPLGIVGGLLIVGAAALAASQQGDAPPHE